MAAPSSQGDATKKHYLHRWVLYISIPQLAFGVISIIFQIVLILCETDLHAVSQGIWAGLLVSTVFVAFLAAR